MKANTHPKTHPVIYVDVATKDEFFGVSTLTSDETRDVDGVTYYVIQCDVTSSSHPFFTGEQRFVDRQGLVDRFKKKQQKAAEARAKLAEKQSQKKEAATPKEVKSYQEVLRASKKQVAAQAA